MGVARAIGFEQCFSLVKEGRCKLWMSRRERDSASFDVVSAVLDDCSDGAVQHARLAFFIKIGIASSFGFTIYAMVLGQVSSVVLTLTSCIAFCISAFCLSRLKNYGLACGVYLAASAYAICTASIYTGQAYSESLWLLPIVPSAAAYLLGRKAAIQAAILCALGVAAVHVSQVFVTFPELVKNSNLDSFVLRLTGLGMFTAFGLWTTSTSDRQLSALSAKTRQLEIERANAQAANEAKSSFLENMSHEIRTPMNGMIGMTRHLQDRICDPEDRADLETVINSQQSLLALLNDILDFSEIEAGHLELDAAEFDLLACIRDVVFLFRPRAIAKGVELQGPERTEPLFIHGDEKRLRRVLCNLVGNAIKFSDDGCVQIDLQTQYGVGVSSAYRDMVRLFVMDQGIGMAQDQVARLFNKFEQLHDTVALDTRGTGLGLAIAKELLEAMKGSISAKSVLGEGSTFIIELPTRVRSRAKGERSTFGAYSGSAPKLDDRGAPRTPARVLVVDDNAINRRVASLALKKLGCEVEQAVDGQEAVEVCRSEGFDLIFMDLRMPKLNGIGATLAIRSGTDGVNQKTPIVALTANAYEEDRRRCREVGMQDHLAKPFRNEDLERVLQQFVRTPKGAQGSDIRLAA